MTVSMVVYYDQAYNRLINFYTSCQTQTYCLLLRTISGISLIYLRHIPEISQAYLMYVSGLSQAYLTDISNVYQAYLTHI